MKHPHPGRIAEVYRKTPNGKLVYVGYTAGPFATRASVHSNGSLIDLPNNAKWNDTIQGWVLPPRERLEGLSE